MMNLFRATEFRVGFLVLVVSVLIGILSLQATEDPGFMGGSKKVFFRIEDASGLIPRGAVKMAGINVGIIKRIELENGKARLDLVIRKDVPVTTSSSIDIRPNGILGDKYVEIVPGNPNDPLLEDGGEIQVVSSSGSLDNLLKEVGKITKTVGEIADELKAAATDNGAAPKGPLGRIIRNIDRLTADLADISTANKEKINDIVANVQAISNTLDEVINDEGPDGLKANWAKVSRSLDKLDRAVANVEDITDKVNSGKGTIGRLVNDEKTVEQINAAVEGVNKFVGGANKMQTSIGFQSEYLAEQGLAKSYLGVKIQPGLDRYYEIQIVDDPKGVVERVDTSLTTNPGTAGEITTNSREIKTFKNKIKFTVLYAKNFWDFTIKAGLMENTGGVGFDYYLFRRKLKLTLDAFDFSASPVHMRTYARYYFYKGVFLVGGADDFLNRTGTASSFAGAGIDITNDDIKTFMGKVSF